MLDSLLDSVSKRVLRLNNITDIAVAETDKLAKIIESSELDITQTIEKSKELEDSLNKAIGDLAVMRSCLREAEAKVRQAQYQGFETGAVMDSLKDVSGNAAQFAMPESRDILISHDPILFEQSASMLNEKDLKRAIGRLKIERVQLIYSLCSDIINAENEEVD